MPNKSSFKTILDPGDFGMSQVNDILHWTRFIGQSNYFALLRASTE